MPAVEALIDSKKWEKLRSIGMVESERRIDGLTTLETRYCLILGGLKPSPSAKASASAPSLW